MKKEPQVNVANSTIVERGTYANTLREIVDAGFCPFCEEHLFKHHQRPVRDKSEHWIVTENSWPYEGTQFHILFIARVHVGATEDLSPAAWRDLHSLYKKFIKETGVGGGTLMIRSGNTDITGASVNHLHAHLIVGSSRTKQATPIKAVVGFNNKK
jgi:ATP adenylyltransferase